MKRVVCAVFDSAIQAYGLPIFVVAAGAAVRSFTDEVKRNSADSVLASHPSDFELHQLCVFDEETGEFTEQERRCLIRGKDIKE